MPMKEQPRFLPMSLQEARKLGIEQFDVILISGDAYVDHPSFAAAIIGRVLWDAGYSVGIIAQPDCKKDDDFRKLGRPRLFFGISSGNVDSLVNNLTPNLKRRSSDVYSPGGALLRPDRATIVYTNKVHALFPGVPIILGGIEASLRRFAHYDYWSDSVRQSILADAPADLIIYGMGENPLREVALRLEKGERIEEIRDVAGTTVKEEISRWRSAARAKTAWSSPASQRFPRTRENTPRPSPCTTKSRIHFHGRAVVQPHPKTVIIQNPPARPLRTEELDRIYELPFAREAHPSYREPIPALEPVRFSITSHRGCFGSCSFCALTHHQGRIVQSRSEDSILREATKLTKMKGFQRHHSGCGRADGQHVRPFLPALEAGSMLRQALLGGLPHLDKDHSRQVDLLRRLRKIPGVKRVFIGSGIRHDLIMADSFPLSGGALPASRLRPPQDCSRAHLPIGDRVHA